MRVDGVDHKTENRPVNHRPAEMLPHVEIRDKTRFPPPAEIWEDREIRHHEIPETQGGTAERKTSECRAVAVMALNLEAGTA